MAVGRKSGVGGQPGIRTRILRTANRAAWPTSIVLGAVLKRGTAGRVTKGRIRGRDRVLKPGSKFGNRIVNGKRKVPPRTSRR